MAGHDSAALERRRAEWELKMTSARASCEASKAQGDLVDAAYYHGKVVTFHDCINDLDALLSEIAEKAE